MVIPHSKAGSHALLTRSPLGPKPSFDLHVLSMPPAFVLSQDQTLKLTSALSAQYPKAPDQDTSEEHPVIKHIDFNRGYAKQQHAKPQHTAARASLPLIRFFNNKRRSRRESPLYRNQNAFASTFRLRPPPGFGSRHRAVGRPLSKGHPTPCPEPF